MSRSFRFFLVALMLFATLDMMAQEGPIVPQAEMERIFSEIRTPFKYGIVFRHPDTTKLIDSPTIFRVGNKWYMSYIVFDGKGYETWLAVSNDLLNWSSKGRLMSFTQNTWDANQKGGYMALVDITWGGSYAPRKYQGSYWMSYLGGATEGYEAGTLGIGMATASTVEKAVEWNRLARPVLLPGDADARWFEKKTIYKSSVIIDEDRKTGYPFVMYYNAIGDTAGYESIGMAVSNDMKTWKRMGANPVITRYKGICGDAQIVRIGHLYVMFYFGAFWKPGAFERFACSSDLVHWTDWTGADLVSSSEDYDQTYAHKPWVIKWKGTVYHFYNAVGTKGRVLALATSEPLKEVEIN